MPGLAAAFFSLISFLLVLFKLPESRDANTLNDSDRIARSSVFSGAFWTPLLRRVGASKNSILPILMFCMLLLSFGQSSLYSAFPLFCSQLMALSAEQVGMQFVYMGLVAVFIQGGMIRPLEKRFGEKNLFLTGSVIMVAGLALIPFATSGPLLTAFLLLMTAGASLNGPTLTSLISKQADPARVGAVMGSSQGFSALGRVIGPTWGGALFAVSYRLPFVFTALVISLTIWVGIRLVSVDR